MHHSSLVFLITVGSPHSTCSLLLQLLESARSFIPIQFGLSCFRETAPASFEAHTFNIYVFPGAFQGYHRRFSCEVRWAGAFTMSSQQGHCRGTLEYRRESRADVDGWKMVVPQTFVSCLHAAAQGSIIHVGVRL